MSPTTSKLQAKLRAGAGKGFARRARGEGLIPAVVYGPHLSKPLNISVDPLAVRAATKTPKRLNTLIEMSIDGDTRKVLLKDYQLDPVSKELQHADFLDVRENEEVKVQVPVVLTGRAAGTLEGGILSQMRRSLEVWTLPLAIPESVEVDITELKIGQALHVKDIALPSGIRVKSTVNYTIAVVTVPEVEKVVETVDAAAAAAPGAPGAPAGAAAPGAAAPAAAAGAAAPAGDKKAAEAKPAAKK